MADLLADQCFDARLVQILRNRRHDVVFVQETAPGASDVDVLAASYSQSRTLLTFDKGFGELAFKASNSAFGILLLRDEPVSPAGLHIYADLIEQNLAGAPGHFTTIQDQRVRRRKLP